MSYEAEQRRLLQLWDEVEEEEPAIGSDSENEFDQISERTDDSCSEQDISDDEEDIEEAEETVVNHFIGKDKVTQWNKFPKTTAVRTRVENIIIHLPGVKPVAKHGKTPIECWELFVNNTMLADIVKYTNQRIELKGEEYNVNNKSHVRQTTLAEVKAVIGLLYLAGVFRSNRQNLQDLWATDGTGIEIFRLTMSLNRFRFVLSCFRFDNAENRDERRIIDKLAPIRGIFEMFVVNCQKCFTPSEYVAVDEQLMAFRGRCSFKQYIPSKPAKYGLKIFVLADSKFYYVLNMEIYPGKQPDGPYVLSNKPEDVVLRLIQPISNSRRNVTFDNWFTSYPLVVKLLKEHKLTSVGTIKKNKAILPLEMLATKDRTINSSMFGFQADATIVSYVPKKGKNVLLISTLHHDDKIDEETGDAAKPEIITFYNSTKGAVDTVDQLSGTYNVARNSNRWPLTIFYSLLNAAGINSMVLHKFNNSETNTKRKDYLKQLGLELISPALEERKSNTRIPRSIRQRILERYCTAAADQPPPKRCKNSGRCSLCSRSKDRKSYYKCLSCENFICMEHSNQICDACCNN